MSAKKTHSLQQTRSSDVLLKTFVNMTLTVMTTEIWAEMERQIDKQNTWNSDHHHLSAKHHCFSMWEKLTL